MVLRSFYASDKCIWNFGQFLLPCFVAYQRKKVHGIHLRLYQRPGHYGYLPDDIYLAGNFCDNIFMTALHKIEEKWTEIKEN